MSTIVLHSRSGRDGVLHLEVPVGRPDADFEVEVSARPRISPVVLPPGYFDLIGSIDDETFVVHPQPPVPGPLKFE